MAQPAAASFPPSESILLLVRELKRHLETLSGQVQKTLENHQLAQQGVFLRDFAHNVIALNKLLSSIVFNEVEAHLRHTLEEVALTLRHILNMPLETKREGSTLTALQAIKNFSNPSTRESDLSIFLTSLEKYPESFRILTQELNLLTLDLNKYL